MYASIITYSLVSITVAFSTLQENKIAECIIRLREQDEGMYVSITCC